MPSAENDQEAQKNGDYPAMDFRSRKQKRLKRAKHVEKEASR
jgi:hypothetical protein